MTLGCLGAAPFPLRCPISSTAAARIKVRPLSKRLQNVGVHDKAGIDPEEKFLRFTFGPETGPKIRTLALCLVLHYENTLPLRISARIRSSIQKFEPFPDIAATQMRTPYLLPKSRASRSAAANVRQLPQRTAISTGAASCAAACIPW